MYLIKITFEATDDLVNIYNYTYTTYGEEQLISYSSQIDKAISFIKNNPLSGFSRLDIPEGYKSYPVNQHIIIYRIENEIIYIIRMLHRKMNFNYQF